MNISGQNSRIKKLSPLLINQLSAGEVVTRPASVVKELLENSIDSGATEITINITQGGMGLIEVVDNGSGIHPDDMLMAITRHATSKVADVEHLQGISTLGFRGEALASISAVSRLSIISSHDDSGVGRCLTVAGKIDTPDISPVVCQQGTTISVRDLYFNVPARRGNLKSISTEYAHIESVIRQVALVYANVELKLFYEGRVRLHLPITNKGLTDDEPSSAFFNTNPSLAIPINRLKEALSIDLPNAVHELFIDLSGLVDSSEKLANIQGWVWISDHLLNYAEKTVDLPKLIYINSRLVKDNSITQQIRNAIQAFELSTKDFGYALFFTLPDLWLNLNVHPSKQRINIHALSNINAHLQHGLQQILQSIFTAEFIDELRNKKVENDFLEASKANVDYANSHYSHLSDSSKKNNQVASPQAVYQVDRVNRELSDEGSKSISNIPVASENKDHDMVLADSLVLVTHKEFEPLLSHILSNQPNQWQFLEKEFLDFKKSKSDCSVECLNAKFLSSISVMWSYFPIDNKTVEMIEDDIEECIVLIFIHKESLATQSAIYYKRRKLLEYYQPLNKGV